MATAVTQSDVRSEAAGVAGNVDVRTIGGHVMRYGLALVIAWIGAMKFTTYEAEAIQGLVANSPLMGWIYGFLSVQGASNFIGTSEIFIAALIAARLWSPRLSAVGSALAIGMFLSTVSFLFSTPGVTEASLGGFPALSVVPGQFLVKDIVLLGVAVWSFGEAWEASRRDARVGRG